MSVEWITILMFGSMIVLLLLGLPLAFVTGLIAAVFGMALFGPKSMLLISSRIYSFMNEYVLVSVPMFIKAAGQETGATSDANVMTIDVMPTIAKLTGFEIPWKVDGVVAGTRTDPEKIFRKATVNPFGVDMGGGSFSIALPGIVFIGPNMKIAKMGEPMVQEIELVIPGNK